MGQIIGDAEDVLNAGWRFAGGNRRVCDQAAVGAGSDVCVSQDTVGGL